MNKFYLTAAIPYVNASPHLGHALEFVQCDVIGRYHRLINEETLLLTGADENSLKNVQAAENLGISIRKLCDENSKRFQDLMTKISASFDIFQRSSSKKHYQGSQKLWQLCYRNGDIYKKKYKGLYCIGCEAFYTKDELTPEGKCKEHLTFPQEVEEENYFFRLSKYQKILLNLIEKDKLRITPQTRKNEVVSFIKMGLTDFSISRSRERAKNWGVPVPNDPAQIMYVWFDALNVYQTGIGFTENMDMYGKWWPADLHVIGKGIIRFHAVYWPAILMSAKLDIPKSIFVHGYLTIEGQKMSKTLGNIIDPFIIINEYGSDAVRYYLLREIPSYSDGDFSKSRFKELYNAELANGLGNLVGRCAKLCEKGNIKVPEYQNNILSTFKKYKKIMGLLSEYKFDDYIKAVQQNVSKLDLKLEDKKPWQYDDKIEENLPGFLPDLIISIREIAELLLPIIPDTGKKILDQFSKPRIQSAPPLFPRLK